MLSLRRIYKHWDWDRSYNDQALIDLEWGENEEQVSDVAESESDNEVDIDVESSPIPAEGSSRQPSSNSSEERNIRPPVWMQDYVSGEGLSEEEIDAHLALFASADPVRFEEAVCSDNWKEAMDSEIQSIEKNETWFLTDLPAG